MMNCENCGRVIADNAVICPNCGAATPASMPRSDQPRYTPPQSGYPPQQGYMPPPQSGYMAQQQNYGYQQQPPMYPPQGVNVTVVNNAPPKNNTPIIVEVLLSLFGIYGVGWLMAGETTTGILLLIGSFVIYWPVLILIAVFTLGLGLACDFPLGIAAIVINAILLNNMLNRKATQITMVQTRR